MRLNEENDTLDFKPQPYLVENDGNLKSTGKVYSTKLWTSAWIGPMPYNYYKFRIGVNESSAYDWALDSSWAQMTNTSASAPLAYYGSKWQNISDAYYLHIYLKVPPDEPPGVKLSTTTITCEQNETI
jgi:hypothetical protein